jgi:hypothetical protein
MPDRRRRRAGQAPGHPARRAQTSAPPSGSMAAASTAGLLTRGSSAGSSPSQGRRSAPTPVAYGCPDSPLTVAGAVAAYRVPRGTRPHSLRAPSRGARPLSRDHAAEINKGAGARESNRRIAGGAFRRKAISDGAIERGSESRLCERSEATQPPRRSIWVASPAARDDGDECEQIRTSFTRSPVSFRTPSDRCAPGARAGNRLPPSRRRSAARPACAGRPTR